MKTNASLVSTVNATPAELERVFGTITNIPVLTEKAKLAGTVSYLNGRFHALVLGREGTYEVGYADYATFHEAVNATLEFYTDWHTE